MSSMRMTRSTRFLARRSGWIRRHAKTLPIPASPNTSRQEVAARYEQLVVAVRCALENRVDVAADRIARSEVPDVVHQQIQLAGREILLRLRKPRNDHCHNDATLEQHPAENQGQRGQQTPDRRVIAIVSGQRVEGRNPAGTAGELNRAFAAHVEGRKRHSDQQKNECRIGHRIRSATGVRKAAARNNGAPLPRVLASFSYSPLAVIGLSSRTSVATCRRSSSGIGIRPRSDK